MSDRRDKWPRLKSRCGAVLACGVLFAVLIVPSVLRTMENARRERVRQNMKIAMISVHGHHDVFSVFPTDITSEEGEALLSWRVRLLPHLENGTPFHEFDRTAAWDSAANRKFRTYVHPWFQSSHFDEPGVTPVLVPTGERTVNVLGDDAAFRSLTDGAANTILLLNLDGRRAVPFTKPEDVPFDVDDPKSILSGPENTPPVLAGMANGSVRTLSDDIDADVLRRLIDPQDGESVE